MTAPETLATPGRMRNRGGEREREREREEEGGHILIPKEFLPRVEYAFANLQIQLSTKIIQID